SRNCLNTSRSTTIGSGFTRRWAISAQQSSSCHASLRRVSDFPGQDHDPIASARSDRISRVVIGLELAYVNRRDRGCGYGRYLALAVTHWLGECRVNGNRCVSKGVEVLLHSDFYSEGGATVF